MKKINVSLALAVVLIVVFTSCQKEPANNPPKNPLKVKTYTEDITSYYSPHFVTTFNLMYDGNDRLVSMTDAANAGNRFVYTYPSSQKYTLDLFDDNVLELHVDFFLNGQSLPDSSFQYLVSDDDTTTEKYIYNAAGRLTRLLEYEYSALTGSDLWLTTDYTYDAAGNLVKSENRNEEYIFEYYTDKKYQVPQIASLAPPNQQVNLLKKTSLIYSGTVIGSVTHDYTFDSKDRIITIRNDYSDGTVVIKTFSYFD